MKRTLLIILSVGLIAGIAVACSGADVADEIDAAGEIGIIPLPDYIEPDNELLSVNDGSDEFCDTDTEIELPDTGGGNNFETTIAAYFSIRGEIISIEDVEGVIYIRIIDQDGNEAVLVPNEDTAFPFSDSYEVGDVVTGWYLTNAPVAMIWPPQYNVSVLVAGAPDDVNIKVDLFHTWEDRDGDYFLSQGGDFAFNVDENTEIILEDGIEFTEVTKTQQHFLFCNRC